MLGQKRIPSREGGVEIVVEELAIRMARNGQNVTCFNRSGHDVAGREYNSGRSGIYQGIRIVNVFTLDYRGLAAFTASVSASVRAAFGKYDVVHFHAEGPCAMLWLPKLFGKRCVATIHGLDHQRAKWGAAASAYIRMGERCAVKYADEIIVLSKNVQQYFMDTYGRETVFIPNGVNPPEFREPDLIRKNYGLEKNGYILYLARLVPEKGLQYLIDAFRRVKTDKKLVIVGASADTDSFANEMKRKASGDSRILFTGFQQGQILAEFFSNAYVYTLPSNLEGMPLSLLEAMSYGNCCLTSDIPECADVIGDHGVTFPRGDTDALRRKLQWLIDHPETAEKYRRTASEYICSKNNWDRVAEQTLALYRG